MNRVPGNQLGFEFGPLAVSLSLSSLSRWFEDLRKTWSRTSAALTSARAHQGPRTAEKRAVGPISTLGVRQRRFISEDPFLCPTPPPSISFKPPTVALGFSSSSSTRLSLFFLNLIFYLVMLLSRNTVLLYCISCTAFCYYGEVPIEVAVKVTNKELVFLSSKKACRDQLQNNWNVKNMFLKTWHLISLNSNIKCRKHIFQNLTFNITV